MDVYMNSEHWARGSHVDILLVERNPRTGCTSVTSVSCLPCHMCSIRFNDPVCVMSSWQLTSIVMEACEEIGARVTLPATCARVVSSRRLSLAEIDLSCIQRAVDAIVVPNRGSEQCEHCVLLERFRTARALHAAHVVKHQGLPGPRRTSTYALGLRMIHVNHTSRIF